MKHTLPHIPEEEQTPTVRLLVAFIEQQQETILKQQTEIESLKAEIARLKKLPPKPKIRPSKLAKGDKGKGSGKSGKSTTSRKRKKKLIIHKTEIIKPDNLPKGSRLLGYEDYTVQDMVIRPYNTRYRLARYRTPDGTRVIGVLPEELQGIHFGITLKSYILHQWNHHVQPKAIEFKHPVLKITTSKLTISFYFQMLDCYTMPQPT